MTRSCLLALGSNLGDRLACMQGGVAGLHRHGYRKVAASSLWESEAFGGHAGSPYLNAILEVALPAGDPWRLLGLCKQLEVEQGRRQNDVRNAPRPLDLDILAIEGLLVRSPVLSLPHPRMQGRAFVWRPLQEMPGLSRFFLDRGVGRVRGALRRVAGPDWPGLQRLPEELSEDLPVELPGGERAETQQARSVQKS